jgi:streptogramin lyase
MVCGILLVSLSSSPASAKLPAEGRETTLAVSTVAFPGAAQPAVPAGQIRVYPVGTGGKDDDKAYAYIVIDGKIWYCEDTIGRRVSLQ